ncbi:MAG TPA: C-GCAxxG-C-C family protein [Bacteroidales bacterium]|nr:C-GCAxxG-C-C family protein [Bacteroidales bacterium]
MEDRKKQAINLFDKGYNCAQSVIGAYQDKLGKRADVLMDMAAGFGGGMGRLQRTCGAVTGAFMVMSSLSNHSLPGAKERLESDIQAFARRFRKQFGELNCKTLLGYDLNSDEELQKAHEELAFNERCSRFIEYAVELLDELLDHKPPER